MAWNTRDLLRITSTLTGNYDAAAWLAAEDTAANTADTAANTAQLAASMATLEAIALARYEAEQKEIRAKADEEFRLRDPDGWAAKQKQFQIACAAYELDYKRRGAQRAHDGEVNRRAFDKQVASWAGGCNGRAAIQGGSKKLLIYFGIACELIFIACALAYLTL